MKNFLSVFLSLFIPAVVVSAQLTNPTLMTVNGKKISLSEFEYIYNKNNSNEVVDKKSLEEYIGLFTDFKLKVEEALAQGLDTTQAFKSELGMYRGQLEEQYLTDNKMTEKLVQEAYSRKKEEVETRHILVKISEPFTSADTLKAYNKAMEIYKRAQKEDFEKLAREVSEDPSVGKNGGYIGWITSLRTPYSFENVAFNTPVGTVSKPVRTIFGYHIIKITNKRQSPGEVKVAHILLLNEPNNPSKNIALKNRIDSLYRRLQAGDDFGMLAEKFSQDPGSARQKGELPWFSSGQMIPEFENISFGMQNKGEYSKPFLSQYGWHIVKLIDKRPLAGFEEMKMNLEGQVKQSDRATLITHSLIDNLKKNDNYTQNDAALADYYDLIDKYLPTDSLFLKSLDNLKKPLFTFADKTFTQKDFNDFLVYNVGNYRGVRSDFIRNNFNEFVNNQMLKYEKTQLDSRYPDFHNLMQEYHDGILLFDIMNKEVWDKASQDKEGLQKFFEANKKNYMFQKPHFKGRVVLCKDKETMKLAQNIVKRAENDSIDKFINTRLNDSIQYAKIEKGLWVEGENQVVDAKIFKKGVYTPSKEYPYYFTAGKLLKTAPENYEDVRGVVTADYQDYLEKEWIKKLRQKYPVVIDEKVLKTVNKN